MEVDKDEIGELSGSTGKCRVSYLSILLGHETSAIFFSKKKPVNPKILDDKPENSLSFHSFKISFRLNL